MEEWQARRARRSFGRINMPTHSMSSAFRALAAYLVAGVLGGCAVSTGDAADEQVGASAAAITGAFGQCVQGTYYVTVQRPAGTGTWTATFKPTVGAGYKIYSGTAARIKFTPARDGVVHVGAKDIPIERE